MGNTKMGMNFYSESLFFTQTKPTGEVSGQPALLHVVSQGFSLLLQHHFLTLSSKFTKRPNHLCLQATHPLAIWPNVGENAPDSVLASSDLPLHPFSLQTFFFFSWLHLWPVYVPRPGIEPVPQQWPKTQWPEPQQWQCQILNPLSHQGTPISTFLKQIIMHPLSLYWAITSKNRVIPTSFYCNPQPKTFYMREMP